MSKLGAIYVEKYPTFSSFKIQWFDIKIWSDFQITSSTIHVI